MQQGDIDRATAMAAGIRRAIEGVVLGQGRVVEELLTAFLAGGHVLLEGVPGQAKTLTVRSLAAAVDLRYARIQFTPDLMPADVTGVNVFDNRTLDFVFRRGPLFADIVLADEINRAPAKTQSALLEAMQESQVTVDGVEHPLSDLFTVVATQNPVEYEGTYPLPEAQLDRFLMKIVVDYPEPAEELAILTAMNALGQRAQAPHQTVQAAASDQDIRDVRSLVREVVADESVLAYITKIVQQTRGLPSLSLGASTRSAVMLLQAAKALALLRGSGHVRPDEVQGVAHATLRHRLTLTPEARIEGLTADDCVADLLKQVPVPR